MRGSVQMALTAVWGAGKRAAGNLLEGAFVGRRRWADSRLAFAGSTISPLSLNLVPFFLWRNLTPVVSDKASNLLAGVQGSTSL